MIGNSKGARVGDEYLHVSLYSQGRTGEVTFASGTSVYPCRMPAFRFSPNDSIPATRVPLCRASNGEANPNCR